MCTNSLGIGLFSTRNLITAFVCLAIVLVAVAAMGFASADISGFAIVAHGHTIEYIHIAVQLFNDALDIHSKESFATEK